MKKNVLLIVTGIIATVLLSSCTSIPSSTTAEIGSANISVVSNFERDEYIILGKVTAESNYVSVNKDPIKNIYIGDTQCYGSLNKTVTLNSPFSLAKTKVTISPVEIARQNAYYDLIDRVAEMGGDFILEPLEQVETKVEKKSIFGGDAVTYKVKVSAIVVQLKRDTAE